MIYSIVLFFIMTVYAFFILLLAKGIKKVPYFTTEYQSPQTKFTVIVPFRNEAKFLPELLNSISELNYPTDLFEVILVDDASNDGFQIANYNFDYTVLQNIRKSNSPKKDAIETAIHEAKYSWIITTDADCLVPENWLKTLDSFIRENEVEMVVGVVSYQTNEDFLHHFQLLEMVSLQGATIGSFGIAQPFMCNGANFAYSKNLFQTLNGFEDSNHIASGDDVFLLQKALYSKDFGISKIGYLKSHDYLVLTDPCFTLKSLMHQRIRWASKATAYKTVFAKILALSVFLGNLSIVFGFIFCLFGIIPFWDWYLLFGIKISVDFVLQYQTGKFIQPRQIRYYLLSTLLYPFFSVGVALLSFWGKYEWKGRMN
ncbi:glycosyltransferase [Flavobacterium antarcticum]|uniref:glycosyltransferase family 2 protein n=1 Tax=Flavobacterium antarcticum TaxID=271155 RepID=UPI0003B3907D|nr:glycosyltransferase [Flavobacterium antarcticum]